MASLRIPFKGVSLQDLYKNIKRGIIKRIPRTYSDDLYDIIKLMLTQNPKRRPSTTELLKNSTIKEKLISFGLLDLVEMNEDFGKLL